MMDFLLQARRDAVSLLPADMLRKQNFFNLLVSAVDGKSSPLPALEDDHPLGTAIYGGFALPNVDAMTFNPLRFVQVWLDIAQRLRDKPNPLFCALDDDDVCSIAVRLDNGADLAFWQRQLAHDPGHVVLLQCNNEDGTVERRVHAGADAADRRLPEASPQHPFVLFMDLRPAAMARAGHTVHGSLDLSVLHPRKTRNVLQVQFFERRH